jgi:hypothetical protein
LILTNDLTLEAVLGGAVSANQPEFHVDYFVRDNNAPQQNIAWQPPKPSTLRGALNSTTDVTLISPTTGRYSTQGFVAEVTGASIYNKDTTSVTATVKTTDGSTDRLILKVTLLANETLVYAGGEWFVLTSSGAIKTNSGISSISSSTDNAVVRWDGAGGGTLQNSAFVVDDSGQVTSFGGNIKFPATQAASADANTLDDYEEGTMTLSDGSGAGLSITNNGSQFYLKAGRLAHVQMDFSFPSTVDGSNAQVTGLAFTNSATACGFAIGYCDAATALQALIGASTSSVVFHAAAGSASQTNANMTTARVRVAGAYQV